MEAEPTTTQSGRTQSGQNNKKRRTEHEDDNRNGRSDTESLLGSDDDSDGELTFEESENRKRKKAARRREETEDRHRDAMMANLADAPDIPNSASQISQAIYEYVRMLMGISRKSRSVVSDKNTDDPTLPPPPTETEMNAWTTRREDREESIKSAIEKAMRKYIASKPAGFKPNRKQKRTVERDAAERARSKFKSTAVAFTSRLKHSSSSRYPHSWGLKCEAAFAMAGFPRCTFDWEAGYESPWNSSISTIILDQWVKCFDARGARSFNIIASDNKPGNREEILRRWFTNKKSDYRKQSKREVLMKTPGGPEKIAADKAYSKKCVSRRRTKNTIYNARKSVAVDVFGAESGEAEIISQREIHSDDDLTSSTPSKVRFSWRSAELDTFISLIDQCVWSRETVAAARRSARNPVERGPYSTTPDVDVFPPKLFQRSLVSPTWISSMSGVAVRNLKLSTTDKVNILRSIEKLTLELSAPSTSQ
ncbi:uncharacterized protein MELLADRAFT_85111 [Melampsora larici-populina 98AG31]|uniref:Uncharacterized protein n=1 Tax=Melampsora larici-populina (strain 98AG31 / pathotype 3-4-7) TaxID=747676 RepID=F4SCW7_MELLP|nr:uncharacterized protein MELLADRAFT_85111 [Melampsora larici-populina 98AG31]EGF97512.1 hypothetical protein MELLADRAFT_85111 [Melampsora larici-populina 98AG31]